VQPADKGSLAT